MRFFYVQISKTNNIEIDWTLEDWWNKCRDIFCIVDSNFLDFFWYKYEWKYEQNLILIIHLILNNLCNLLIG